MYTRQLIVYTAMFIWGLICMFVRKPAESFIVGILWYGLAWLIAMLAAWIIGRI